MDGLGEAVSILINEAMKVERSSTLNTQPWQRTESRMGYANGFKNKSVLSKMGKLHLDIPQVRGDVEFYPSVQEKRDPLKRPYNYIFRVKKSNIEIKWQERIDIIFQDMSGT